MRIALLVFDLSPNLVSAPPTGQPYAGTSPHLGPQTVMLVRLYSSPETLECLELNFFYSISSEDMHNVLSTENSRVFAKRHKRYAAAIETAY